MRRQPSSFAPISVILALAPLALFACSGPNIASKLTDAPTFQPRDQSKCGVVKSQAEPLIVEWPDAARGKLESMVKRGLVAVRYEGCDMEVLGQCSIKGAYRYASVNPKRSLVKMRDADELYANIPAYAAKFESVLQKAGELNVSMTIVGRYETDDKTFELSDLEGHCDGATHVVSALTVGAFDFYAGAEAEVGAGVTVGNAGAGAKSSARRTSLNQDGSADACEKAKREDTVPPYGCGALLRIEVVLIHGAKEAKAARAAQAEAVASMPEAQRDATAARRPTSGPGPTDDDDGDGVDNAHDNCPKDPGPASNHGCPLDRDGDGIPDVLDACPDVKGVASSDPKENGCPPRAAPVVVKSSSVQIRENIGFETAKATIKATSFKALDDIADVLKSHSDIKQLRIEAHSDNIGAAAVNLRLTQGRADAVKAALVQRGVAAGRLVATGYGGAKPIDTNDTAEGRTRNRRVEFVVVQ